MKGESIQGELATLPTVLPDELIGCSVLLPPSDDGEHLRATIVKKIIDHDEDVEHHPAKVQFLVNVGNDQAEEIYSYTDLLDFLNQESMEEETGEQFFRFKDIIAHQGPLKPGD